MTDDLDDLLSGEEPDWDTEPAPPRDEDTVQRWLYRLAKVREEQAAVRRRAAVQIQQAQVWQAASLEPLERSEEWLERSLTAYHRSLVAEDQQAGRRPRATLSFPTGKLRSTAVKDGVKWLWENDKEVAAWAAANGRTDLLREVFELKKDAAKGVLKPLPGEPGAFVEVVDPETGEKVPGVIAEVVERTYRIETS